MYQDHPHIMNNNILYCWSTGNVALLAQNAGLIFSHYLSWVWKDIPVRPTLTW